MSLHTKEMREILNEFSMLGDWEDRYAYIIDIGKKIEPLGEEYKIASYKVMGCSSQAWIVSEKIGSNNPTLIFTAESDSYIVKGLIALLLRVYSGKKQDQIEKIEIKPFFEELGLKRYLSPSRSNGFFSMVQRIRQLSL